VLGLAYLLLAVRRNLWCWLCAFLSTGIFLVLVAKAALYMQVLLNLFYLGMAVYGYIDWRRGRAGADEVQIRSWTVNQHVMATLLVIIATLVNGWILATSTDSPAPYLDSFVAWGSVVTTWMVARRIIENWLYWVVVDGAAAWLHYNQGLLAMALLFVIYIGIVIRGYFVWRREQALQSQAASVAPSPMPSA
jgi:nicotinamide mononucleotide transporter